MTEADNLNEKIKEKLSHLIKHSAFALNELTLEIESHHLKEIALKLRDDPDFDFKLLADVCGVDYLHYGISEWETDSATGTGFSRGVDCREIINPVLASPRFAAVYHLLSINKNQRVRLRVFTNENNIIPSVMDIWPAANWFEREAFDLFGIIFDGHPDLRRILTDYGFNGHPFRKDFPLIGQVEARYDGKLQRVVYEPVSIVPRVLEPKVIRHDNRYVVGE